jgi:hypothetical protein
MSIKGLIEEHYAGHVEDGPLFVDGFDDALIGICPHTLVVVYSRNKCAKILSDQEGVSLEEALEILEVNLFSLYSGEYTPLFIEDFNWNE